MVKIRIIPKYAQFEFENDLEKSTFGILSISPKSQIEISMDSKKYQSMRNPRG
jgi:hypothetical protein